MATELERIAAQPAILPRLRRVQAWRRARLQRLLADPEIDHSKRIKAAQHYTAVAMRADAILRGLIER
ncbi:hypothetical protein AAFG13_36675 [Bradyrhizobium sp. B124]|uniref:hypothetical protein n=1 Tax=Bradyrhizobium sp. B124 TaxID=3140245 RepID=UPI003182E88C